MSDPFQLPCKCSKIMKRKIFEAFKAMAPHSSTFAWKIPWEEPGRVQSMGSLESDTTKRLHFPFSLSCIGEGNGNPLQYSCLENPWTEEPSGLLSFGSHRVGHDWATSFSLFTFMHWRRKWQPTPVFLLGESQGRWSLLGCRLWGCTELDTIEAT